MDKATTIGEKLSFAQCFIEISANITFPRLVKLVMKHGETVNTRCHLGVCNATPLVMLVLRVPPKKFGCLRRNKLARMEYKISLKRDSAATNQHQFKSSADTGIEDQQEKEDTYPYHEEGSNDEVGGQVNKETEISIASESNHCKDSQPGKG